MADLGQVLRWAGRNGKRVAVTVLGFALLLGGVVMLVTPGPGLLVVAAGLALLATEYAWARRALDRARAKAKGAAERVRKRTRR
jgi:uncharacterized protein (TIGR02611 family)